MNYPNCIGVALLAIMTPICSFAALAKQSAEPMNYCDGAQVNITSNTVKFSVSQKVSSFGSWDCQNILGTNVMCRFVESQRSEGDLKMPMTFTIMGDIAGNAFLYFTLTSNVKNKTCNIGMTRTSNSTIVQVQTVQSGERDQAMLVATAYNK